MARKQYFVYILTNQSNRVLYTGVTNNLERRIHEHKQKLVEGFTKKYNVNKLVWYAATSDIRAAIEEEKRIKAGSRAKKNEQIEEMNPEWRDLAEDF
jgi:putative endonuclease